MKIELLLLHRKKNYCYYREQFIVITWNHLTVEKLIITFEQNN